MTQMWTDAHSDHGTRAGRQTEGARGNWLRWTLGALWLCITTAVVVRLLTGSEGLGGLALLGAAAVASVVLATRRPTGTGGLPGAPQAHGPRPGDLRP
jgi:hypothetical protein